MHRRPHPPTAALLACLATLALAPALPGCGDGLLGEDGIADLVGLDGLNVPTRPAWVVRWMLDEDYVDGPANEVPAEGMYLDYAPDEDTWYHYVNYLEVDQPGLGAPPVDAIRDFGSWSFAVGVPMLLDDADGDGEWSAPEDEPEELWGVTPESAFFYFDGDLGLLQEHLPVEPWGMPWEEEELTELHPGLQNVWVNPGPLADWLWREEWEDLEEWEQACLDQQEAYDQCVEEFGPDDPMCEELLWQLEDCWAEWEWHHEPLIFPDHPEVASTFHPGAFRVETAQSVEGSGFEGGVKAFLSDAWWAWFPDPDPEKS